MKMLFLFRLVLALAAVALLTACGATQRYYQLSPDGAAVTGTAGLGVGVGPISLPGYVDRAELVFQSGPNEFKVPADAHWTGSLKENVSRVLATDIGRRIGSGNVVGFPWDPAAKLRYRIAVDITRFHTISGEGAVLEAAWRVQTPDGTTTVRRGNAAFQESVSGDGYEPVVATENRLLARLADAMAASLRGR